jgi:hypothetical protein
VFPAIVQPPRVVVVPPRPADLVDLCDRFVQGLGVTVPAVENVERSRRTALRACAVVRENEHQRVIPVAGQPEELEQPAHVVVGVRQEPRECLHVTGVETPRVGRERRPRRNPLRSGRQLRRPTDNPLPQLTLVGTFPPGVPPIIEPAPVTGDPLSWRLVRRVARARAEIQEERLGIVDDPHVSDTRDGLIDEILGEVVAVGDRCRRLNQMIVSDQRRGELVGLAGHESVEALEAATERPALPRRRRMAFVLRGEVPFPDGEGCVALRQQHLRQQPVLRWHAGVVAGEARGDLDDPAHSVGMVVPPRQKARTGRRAHGGGVEVREAHAVGAECVEHGRLDVGPEATQLSKADIVQHDHHDIRCRDRSNGPFRPPRPRFRVVPADHAPELLHRATIGRTAMSRHGG